MGDYNPYAPLILGQEWVPIRAEDVVISAAVDAVEDGHSFEIKTAQTLQEGRFYVKDLPNGYNAGQVININVYPKGFEDKSGPIQRVVIPANAALLTGAGSSSLVGAATIADAFADASNGKLYRYAASGTPAAFFWTYFATNKYAQQLQGKRILAVNVLYAADTSGSTLGAQGILDEVGDVFMSYGNDSYFVASTSTNGLNIAYLSEGTLVIANDNSPINRASLGEFNPLWSPSVSYTTSDRMPWTYAALQRFEASAANRVGIRVGSNTTSASYEFTWNYMALEVIYCEEQRVAVGGRSFGFVSTAANANTFIPFTLGANRVFLRSPVTEASNPVLQPGQYTVTVSNAFAGQQYGSAGPATPDLISSAVPPTLNGLRQLYAMPNHPGVRVNIPFPQDDTVVGKTFTQQEINILPQLSIHTSGGPVTEVHVYGAQAAAQVYGTVTATQDIDEAPLNAGTAAYPQIRFYARHMPGTSTTLIVTSPSVTGAGSVYITPDEFDALEPNSPTGGIVDGWKEVNLRFPGALTLGTVAGDPTIQWSAPGETIATRWEVLSASAPAISGVGGNMLLTVPSPHTLDSATYGTPLVGATIELTYKSPYVTGAAAESFTDAVVILSQDPPTISGVSVSVLSQAITGVGLPCSGITPCCVPTAAYYNHVVWTPASAQVSVDTFTRTVTGGLGTSDTGQAWTVQDGSAAVWTTDGSKAVVTPVSLSTSYISTNGQSTLNSDTKMKVTIPSYVSGTTAASFYLIARFIDTSNNYRMRFTINADGTVQTQLEKVVAGVLTSLGSLTTQAGIRYLAGQEVWLRMQVDGSTIRAKAWLDLASEPSAWNTTLTDTSLTAAGVGGIRVVATAGTVPLTTYIDSFSAIPLSWGAYELQRMDAYDDDWHTIMLATDPGVVMFNDYEARVGVVSSYRMRNVNVLNFASPWSTTATATITSPGVSGGSGTCNSGNSTLIFTSNNALGAYTLANSMVWDRSPDEKFSFPEAETLSLRRMYKRNMQVAFKPTERGGEAFSRVMLLQGAAIAIPSMANSRAIRNFAWANVPYICVRDELGNRWFASVNVPDSSVQRNRTQYYVKLDIVEVSEAPYAVNPGQ